MSAATTCAIRPVTPTSTSLLTPTATCGERVCQWATTVDGYQRRCHGRAGPPPVRGSTGRARRQRNAGPNAAGPAYWISSSATVGGSTGQLTIRAGRRAPAPPVLAREHMNDYVIQ